MKSRMMVVAGMLLCALMTMASQPKPAAAGSSVYVGFNVGAPTPYYDYGPRYVHHRPPPQYYYGWDRWRPEPPPHYRARGWRHYPPPPPVYNYEYRRPHHRHHHSDRDRW
jgi:hypothetical protein